MEQFGAIGALLKEFFFWGKPSRHLLLDTRLKTVVRWASNPLSTSPWAPAHPA